MYRVNPPEPGLITGHRVALARRPSDGRRVNPCACLCHCRLSICDLVLVVCVCVSRGLTVAEGLPRTAYDMRAHGAASAAGFEALRN